MTNPAHACVRLIVFCLAVLLGVPTAPAADAKRKIAVGGEVLHERGACELPAPMAANLSLRPEFTARVLETDAKTPWLEKDGLSKLAPGEVAVWATLSLFGTRYELVAFVVDEKGELLGTVHRQATTRVIPGEGGRFDRVPPGPNQYLQNATVELAADVAVLLRSDKQRKPPDDLRVFVPQELSLDQERALNAFLVVFADVALHHGGLRPILVAKGKDATASTVKPPALEISVAGGGTLSEVFGASARYLRSGPPPTTYGIEPGAKENLLPMARQVFCHLFAGGERILVTFPPDKELPKVFQAEQAEPKPKRPRRRHPYVATSDDLSLNGWKFELPDVLTCGPLEWDKRVSLGCRNGEVITLDAASGKALWRVECGDAPCFVDAAGETLVVSDASGTLYGCSADGKPLWKLALSSPVLDATDGPDGASVVLACEDGALVVVDPAKGEKRAEIRLPARIAFAPLAYDRWLLATTTDGRLFKLDPVQGKADPLAMMCLAPASPLVLYPGCKVPVSALDTVQTDVVTVKDADGNLHVISLTGQLRPRVRFGGKADLETTGDDGLGNKLEIRD